MVLQTYKIKKVGAKKGYDLLKKKSDALKGAFRRLLERLVNNKARMGEDFKGALLSYAEATFAAGDFSKSVTEQVKQKTSVRLSVDTENIAGVQLPLFELKGED